MFYRAFEPLRLKANWLYIVAMFAGSLFTWGPLYYAILHAGIGLSTAVNYASIVLGMFLFGWLLAGERFTRDKAISATLGTIGLICIFAPSVTGFGWLALGAAILSGLSVAWSGIFAKRVEYNATQSTIVLWAASVVANAVMAIILGAKYPPVEQYSAWIYLIIFAVASVIASWSFVKGLKMIDAGAAGVLGLLEIVFGLLFGIVFFHEKPGILALVGAAVIIISAAIPYVKDFNLKRGTLD